MGPVSSSSLLMTTAAAPQVARHKQLFADPFPDAAGGARIYLDLLIYVGSFKLSQMSNNGTRGCV